MPTIDEIKQLRFETDASITDCKSALEKTDGDIEKAKQLLKEMGKGDARTVVPTAGRIVACEMELTNMPNAEAKLIGIAVVRSETDFVAKSPIMLDAIMAAAQSIAYGFQERTEVEKLLSEATYQFGEKIQLGDESIRLCIDYRTDERYATYVHFNGQRAAYVKYRVLGETDNIESAKKIAIQCVATNPQYLSTDSMNQEEITAELEKEKNLALSAGKPEIVANKIAFGKMNKKYQEVVLSKQAMYDDPMITVEDFVKKEGIQLLEFGLIIV